jgi:hypothetical protein
MSDTKRDYVLFLEDIVTAVSKVEKYVKGMSQAEFVKDEKTLDAVVRNFEIIGEAVKSVPESVKKKYPEVEWKEASGFRDVLIHDYFGISIEAVWDTIRNDIPNFKKHISNVYKKVKELND